MSQCDMTKRVSSMHVSSFFDADTTDSGSGSGGDEGRAPFIDSARDSDSGSGSGKIRAPFIDSDTSSFQLQSCDDLLQVSRFNDVITTSNTSDSDPMAPDRNNDSSTDSKSSDNESASSELSSFFSSNNTERMYHLYHPYASFQWPLFFKPLKRSRDDITELVRNSCKKLMEKSQYVEINYDLLAEYAKKVDLFKMSHHKTHLTQFVEALQAETGESLSERTVINMTCLFVILQFGSGFVPLLHTLSAGVANAQMVGEGLCNIYRRYQSFGTKTLGSICVDDVGELFGEDNTQFVCDMMHKCIQKIVLVLSLKHFTDFADYIYYSIDLSWIKSQTKDLSAITTLDCEINDKSQLGLTFAPASSKGEIRRCVVTDFTPNDNANYNAVCTELVAKRAFLYALNDEVIYNHLFDKIISMIRVYLKQSRDDESYQWYTVDGKRMLALQFGMHLDREPDTMQTLLVNLINDFSVLNDQYLYKDLFGNNKHLKVYLFQSAQSLIMELYYNCFVTAPAGRANKIFNFKGIRSLTAVVDNVIPFVFLRDGVIEIKEEFKKEFEKLMRGGSVLRTACDLETEIIASTICAMEMLLCQNKEHMNIAQLVYSLRNNGAMNARGRNTRSRVI